jgi:hypothetical protein
MAFTDERTLQGVIDNVARQYLAQLSGAIPGFADATAAAETQVTGVPTM